MNTVISVDHISKCYQLGQIGTGTLARDLKMWTARWLGRPNPFNQVDTDDQGNRYGGMIWALNNVSFTVKQGEVLGIIGHNGAGKSTLLKILSRVTAPTSGQVKVKGRIASLLEVGTGFHPELTGRENIYLNGAILGMSKKEVRDKFHEIVTFSELEKFIDTPVRRYSSGMYVRLAFAVAAHLEPEILLVDEVLAVGDMAFQKKCLGKMGDVAKEGRTILFVSHNMQAIRDMCTQAFIISKGCIEYSGATKDVIAHYINLNQATIQTYDQKKRTKHFFIQNIKAYGGLSAAGKIYPHDELNIELDIEPLIFTRDISIHYFLYREDGEYLIGLDSIDFGCIAELYSTKSARFLLKIPKCPLPPGTYFINVLVKSHSSMVIDELDHLLTFQVTEIPIYGNRLFSPRWHGQIITDVIMSVVANEHNTN